MIPEVRSPNVVVIGIDGAIAVAIGTGEWCHADLAESFSPQDVVGGIDNRIAVIVADERSIGTRQRPRKARTILIFPRVAARRRHIEIRAARPGPVIDADVVRRVEIVGQLAERRVRRAAD